MTTRTRVRTVVVECPGCGNRSEFTCEVNLVAYWHWYPITNTGHDHKQRRADEPNPIVVRCDCGRRGVRDENGVVAWEAAAGGAYE